jgi:hypothetical protein
VGVKLHQQERIDPLEEGVDELAGHLIEVRHQPFAAVESAAAVFVRAAEALMDAVRPGGRSEW